MQRNQTGPSLMPVLLPPTASERQVYRADHRWSHAGHQNTRVCEKRFSVTATGCGQCGKTRPVVLRPRVFLDT